MYSQVCYLSMSNIIFNIIATPNERFRKRVIKTYMCIQNYHGWGWLVSVVCSNFTSGYSILLVKLKHLKCYGYKTKLNLY